MADLEHEEWLRRRGKITPERIAKVLALLDKAGSVPPEPGDELPEGYVPFRDRTAK